MSEQVLACPETALAPYRPFFKNGLLSHKKQVPSCLDDLLAQAQFIDREAAENDPSFKQIIPYCLLEKRLFWAIPTYFVYRRSPRGQESRLHSLWSLGVGGHVNAEDGNYYQGLQRELHEEVGVQCQKAPPLAIIHDPSNPVGQVHLGVVHLIHLEPNQELVFQDQGLDNGTFLLCDNLLWCLDYFENWSKIVIRELLVASS